MTDNTQEIDEILENLTEERFGNGYQKLTIEEAKQAILDWHNKQVEEVLDRLESLNGSHPDSYIATFIEAERNKLKGEQ